MSTTRVMNGLVDLTGQKCNTFKIECKVARQPEPKYQVRCERCETTTTATHSRLRTGAAQCQFSGCGKPAKRRDLLTEQRKAIAQREAERRAEEQAISSARMEAETDGYQRPERYSPKSAQHVVMSERERIALRELREEQEREERAAREERQRPVREAEANLTKLHQQVAAVQRRRLTDPRFEDVDLWIDPIVDGVGMTHQQAVEWNADAFRTFFRNRPDLAMTNSEFFANYYKKNSVNIVTATMLENLYARAVECGIEFELKPEPKPDRRPAPYDKRPKANLTIVPAKQPQKPQPILYDGWDEDGNKRRYTEREVSRWSSEEMKRRLRLYPEKLTLPTVGPGPLGSRYQ